MKMARVKGKKAKRQSRLMASVLLLSIVFAVDFHFLAQEQTGGTYQIEKSVIASGGNASSGGNYSLESTSGQAVAGGFIQDTSYSIHSGFWTPIFAPTAASVSVSGRVMTTDGRGLKNAVVVLADMNGYTRTARTSTFGYYHFKEVDVGQTYIFNARSKSYQFTPQTVSVFDNIRNLNFIATN